MNKSCDLCLGEMVFEYYGELVLCSDCQDDETPFSLFQKLIQRLQDAEKVVKDISFIVDQLLESKVGKFDWYKGDEGQAILKIKELIDNCQSN